MLHGRLIIVFLFFIVSPLVSQKITHYGFKEGLQDEQIVSIYQDQGGILWVGSKNGKIASFNGWKFDAFNFPEIAPGKIINISKGAFGLIVISSKGIVNVNHKANHLLYAGGIQSAITLKDSILIIDDQKKLRILSLINGGGITIQEEVKSMLYIDGNILVLSESNKLFNPKENQSKQSLHDFEQTSTFYWQGRLIQLIEGRLIAIPGELLSQIPQQISVADIQQVLEESPSKIWLLANNELIKVESGKILKYTRDLNFTDALVQCIYKDYEDNIWTGTSNGLYKFHQNTFQLIGELESGDRITTISNGWTNQIWLGTERGKLFSTNNKSFTKDRSFDKVTRESINSAFFNPDNSNLWVTTDHNWLLKLNIDRSYSRYINRNAINANAALQIFSEDKDIWIGSVNRIFKLPNSLVSPFLELTSTIDNHSILAVYKKQSEDIVILTTDNIYSVSENGYVKTPIEFKNLKDKIFTCFEVDSSGKLWIGTWGNGLIFLDNKNAYHLVSIKEGLNSDIISNLLSVENSIYVGTPHGIDKVEVNEENRIDIRHVIDEIMPTNSNTFFLDKKTNTLWFGSGPKCYTYGLNTNFKNSGSATITKATFFGAHVSDTILSTDIIDTPFKLRSKQNTVEFQFLGVSLSYPEGVTYAIRLLGRDSTWMYPIKERSVLYSTLQPGNYRFEVMMYSPEGVPGNSIASVEFEIASPMWKEPWALIGVVSLLISMGWLVIRIRERNKLNEIISKEKRKTEMTDLIRKDIARDFHDNIGNKLAGLKVASNLIRMKLKDDNKEISNLLHDIEKDSQDLFDGTRDFIWSIDPESDNLLEVFSYIKDFGEKTFERSSFTFLSNQKVETDSIIKIPTGWSRQIVMIFKEAMTNSLKHSKGNTIEFLLTREENNYKFVYVDNGKYDGSKNFSGRGMKNMTERARAIGAILNFHTVEDFRIELMVPVNL